MRSKKSSSLILLSLATLTGSLLYGFVAAFPFANESAVLKKVRGLFESFQKENRNERIYIQTDKTYYKPGEAVWFSAFVRNEDDLKTSDYSDIIHIELISPRGNVDQQYRLIAENGVAKGDFDLTGYLGGVYKIRAFTEYQKNDSSILKAEKEITLQTAVLPRLKMKLDFDKKSYGKGDKVHGDLSFTSNENKAIANTKVDYTISLDGNTLLEQSTTTNAEGKANLDFTLPKDLKTTDVFANAKIIFEGNTESISKTVPVVLNQIALSFFPEGGDMIDDVAGKLAFRALNEFDKPVDISGFVFDDNDKVITTFTSLHAGIGAFNFTPKKGATYHAKITKPEGVSEIYTLPDAIGNGYQLSVKSNNTATLSLGIYSFKADSVSILAQTRGKVYYSSSFAAVKGLNNITINTDKMPVGVSQITLFDGKGIPRAERLVFVNEAKQLSVKITPDKPQYKPREKVTLNIRTLDENGLPVSSDLALSVVDDNLLSFADDKQGNILSKMLLEPELKESVFEPNFYFDKKEAKAKEALDNLLLTSGWRRYTWKEITAANRPTIQHKAEKAILAGTVYDANKSRPLPGAKLTLKKSGKTVTTDKDGKFALTNFNISDDHELLIKADGLGENTVHFSMYEQDVTYYLYGPQFMYKGGDRPRPVPMAARGGRGEVMKNKNVEIMEGAVMMDDAMAAPAAAEMMVDVASAKDEADMKDLGEVFQQVPAELLEKEEVGDLRFAEIKKADRKQMPEQVTYYRAKEFPKRVYAKNDTTRSDLATTAYWNGHVTTDMNGKAKVEFVANDLISSFSAVAEGFGADGEIGRGESSYITNIPFSVDAKLPSEMVSGDQANVAVFLKNNTDEKIEGVLDVKTNRCIKTSGKSTSTISLAPKESKLVNIPLEATSTIGEGKVDISFRGNYNDFLSKSIKIVAKGFPANIALAGQQLQKTHFIHVQNIIPGSMKVTFNAYPSVMTELMKGIEAILQEPYGCFEQTSSSNYPNIMAIDYLHKMDIKNPELEKKAMDLLDKGYQKLVSFETKENGYEWFGAAPAHEALTAYGLLEFEDMKKVYPKVDQAMIDRTRKLLLDKRDGKGGFVKNPRALDSFGGADEDITNAYIVYAMTESGYKDLQKELDAVYASAKKTKDAYILALAANSLYNVNDNKRADELMDILVKKQNDFGYWSGDRHSITRSTGDALKIETTSLVGLAMMKTESSNQMALQNGVRYLVGARNGLGGFGSSQSTILALKALTKYAQYSKKTDESGTVEIYVNDKLVASKAYEKGEKKNVTIDSLQGFFKEGKQKVEVKFKGCKNALPYSMSVAYNTSLPQSSKECVLGLETKLSTANTKVGETVRLSAVLKNVTDKGQPMSMAILGIPAGLSVQPFQLKELMDKHVIDFYETTGNNVVCYYRSLAPNESKNINLDLKADIAGTYEAPASSAYLYYTNELKTWNSGAKITIN